MLLETSTERVSRIHPSLHAVNSFPPLRPLSRSFSSSDLSPPLSRDLSRSFDSVVLIFPPAVSHYYYAFFLYLLSSFLPSFLRFLYCCSLISFDHSLVVSLHLIQNSNRHFHYRIELCCARISLFRFFTFHSSQSCRLIIRQFDSNSSSSVHTGGPIQSRSKCLLSRGVKWFGKGINF